jgi:hypothetical protein
MYRSFELIYEALNQISWCYDFFCLYMVNSMLTGISVEFREFGNLGAQGLRGVSFNYMSFEVVRAESSCECMAHISGGDHKGDKWHILTHQGINP